MDFVTKIAEKAIEKKFGGGGHEESYPSEGGAGYGGSGGYGGSTGENLPYPWVARWDEREGRYIYLNEQTGETSWVRPGMGEGYGYGQPQPQPGYGYGQPEYGYGYGERQAEYGGYGGGGYEEPQEKKDHSLAYGAAGAAAGVLGGAFVAHEGEKICISLLHLFIGRIEC